MLNDAQVQSPPNLDVREDERTNENSDVIRGVKVLEYKGLLWTCGLKKICLTALWLPLGALIFCYVTASIFQADDIHETHCRAARAFATRVPSIRMRDKASQIEGVQSLLQRPQPVMVLANFTDPMAMTIGHGKVYNVVPSISAITGISPQRYIWRICIAFHLGPRLLIGSLYYNYHKERNAHIIEEKARVLATRLGEACYWLNLIELFALTGVTYISNRENYFVHEKIFIMFMVAALLHMLCRARVGCIASDVVEPVKSNGTVWGLFFIAIAATVGLIIFFLRHRLLCRPLAFTYFSICEYILATANMAFHGIVVRDLPLHQLQVVCPSHNKAN